MKVLIMSDSHGWKEEVQEVINRHADEVDGIIHCGDSELNADAPVFQETQVVRGNCDMDGALPEEINKKIGPLTFFIAHGHLLNVKTTAMNLLYKAEETSADVICFGHTHVPAALQEKGRILINPGSMRLPREYPHGTYVILEQLENQVDVNFYSLEGSKAEELSKTFTV